MEGPSGSEIDEGHVAYCSEQNRKTQRLYTETDKSPDSIVKLEKG